EVQARREADGAAQEVAGVGVRAGRRHARLHRLYVERAERDAASGLAVDAQPTAEDVGRSAYVYSAAVRAESRGVALAGDRALVGVTGERHELDSGPEVRNEHALSAHRETRVGQVQPVLGVPERVEAIGECVGRARH